MGHPRYRHYFMCGPPASRSFRSTNGWKGSLSPAEAGLQPQQLQRSMRAGRQPLERQRLLLHQSPRRTSTNRRLLLLF